MERKLRQASIDDFANEVRAVWERDQNRPILVQWLGVVDHASRLMEELRKESWDGLAHELAEVFVWWLAFVGRLAADPTDKPNCVMSATDRVLYLGVAPSDVVWSKYPGVCPVCFGFAIAEERNWDPGTGTEKQWLARQKIVTLGNLKHSYSSIVSDRRCKCLARKSECENRAKGFKSFTKNQIERAVSEKICEKKPTTLVTLEKALVKIYQPAIEVLSPEEMAFHLLEEVGEVSQAMFQLHLQPDTPNFAVERQLRLRALREELADVFSWIVTLRAKTFAVLECATDYVHRVSREGTVNTAVEELFKTCLRPVNSLAELVLMKYGGEHESKLHCEGCKMRPCDPTEHPSDNGELFGANALSRIAQLTPLKLSS